MMPADRPDRPAGKVLAIDALGEVRHLRRADLATLFRPGDVVIANDAATLPASLPGVHAPSGEQIEVRLAGWIAAGDFTRFVSVAFGAGDHRTPTELRSPPPPLSSGDRLVLGPLNAVVDRLLGHPRLFALRFMADSKTVLPGLARHGRPIQYAHVSAPLSLWDVWTGIAAEPIAFEPPSAGFALDWQLLAAWRRRDVMPATLTHAAGLSSTGDPVLDRQLPFDEPYAIPESTAAIINQAKARGRRVIAIGTTVVRALESAAHGDAVLQAGSGVARQRIGPETRLRIVDTILTGMHRPGESHFELLRAFADQPVLDRIAAITRGPDYRMHEFGDCMLIERQLPTSVKDAGENSTLNCSHQMTTDP